jgi:hypothetical protein
MSCAYGVYAERRLPMSGTNNIAEGPSPARNVASAHVVELELDQRRLLARQHGATLARVATAWSIMRRHCRVDGLVVARQDATKALWSSGLRRRFSDQRTKARASLFPSFDKQRARVRVASSAARPGHRDGLVRHA